jgi:hypothetical protein
MASRAALLLPVAALAIRALRLERALRLVAALPFPLRATVSTELAPTAHLVHAVTSRLGGGCLTGAIVLHAILLRRGRPALVVIGAARVHGQLRAHAWVEDDGRVLSIDGATGYLALCRIGSAGTARAAA